MTQPIARYVAHADALSQLLQRFGLRIKEVQAEASIPGSYWGEPEAGLIGDAIYVRADTPVHSVLHEACHWVLASQERRARMHTDASDSILEENATCYLQILLADHIPGFGRTRALADMDRWGYSFRLGSAADWFAGDAEDAAQHLKDLGIIDASQAVCFDFTVRAADVR